MDATFTLLATFSGFLRTALLAGGVALALVATADWAVRTRRLNPFGGVARFLRTNVDPRLAGVERQVLRAGGHPSQTPWWAFVAYVVVAALLLAAFDMLLGLVAQAYQATSLGSLGMLMVLMHWTFAFLRFAVLVPTKTTVQARPFIWSAIHFLIAASPPLVTDSQSLSRAGLLPSTVPMLRTCDARQLSG